MYLQEQWKHFLLSGLIINSASSQLTEMREAWLNSEFQVMFFLEFIEMI